MLNIRQLCVDFFNKVNLVHWEYDVIMLMVKMNFEKLMIHSLLLLQLLQLLKYKQPKNNKYKENKL